MVSNQGGRVDNVPHDGIELTKWLMAKLVLEWSETIKDRPKLPGDEEDLALLAVVDGDEVEVKDGVAAVVGGQRGDELVVALAGAAHLVHHDGAGPLVDLVDHEAVHLLPLHLREPPLALLLDVHPLRRLHSHNHKNIVSQMI